MLIAVACDGLTVASSLAHSSSYMCYAVRRGLPVSCRNIPILDQDIAKLPSLLHEIGVNVILVGAIEDNSRDMLCSSGFDVVDGVSGESLQAVREYLQQ